MKMLYDLSFSFVYIILLLFLFISFSLFNFSLVFKFWNKEIRNKIIYIYFFNILLYFS